MKKMILKFVVISVIVFLDYERINAIFDGLAHSENLNNVIQEALHIVEHRRNGYRGRQMEGSMTPVDTHAQIARIREEPETVRILGFIADVIETALKLYTLRYKRLPDPNVFKRYMLPICPQKVISCDLHNRYRTPQGVCNNLNHPEWGSAFTPQARFLPPDYGDQYNLGYIPRTKSVTGHLLPSPRAISKAVFGAISTPSDPIYNLNFIHFSIVNVWDLASTPLQKDNGRTIVCCNGDKPIKRPECFPIFTPPGEFKTTCMTFTRSELAPPPCCYPGPRNQMNMKTSYLDLNWVYGYTKQGEERIRRFGFDHPDNYDSVITTYTFVFTNENRDIVKGLKHYGWSGDQLLREARKILTAIYQHIVYTEYLPVIIGVQAVRQYGLASRKKGFNTVYDPRVDASTRNAFSAAASHFGHSMVDRLNNDLLGLFAPADVKNYSKTLQSQSYRIISQFQGKSDRFFTDYSRNKLFETMPGNGFDLGALTLQRGRDHGLPSYNKFRQFCGLPPILHFGNVLMGFQDHNIYAAKALASVYRHPDDIDLFAGGMSENVVPGGIVGPTFQCLFVKQFEAYKKGDRFFYENKFPETGFTFDQLNEIKKQSLSALQCRQTAVRAMPKNAFVSIKTGHPLVPCEMFPRLDLSLWSRHPRHKMYTY